MFLIFGVPENYEGKIVVQNEITYITSTPIRINSNAELAAVATSGDGSSGNPWVIEGFKIDGTGYGSCIYIGNTTDYFTVRDCYLHDAGYGLNLINVQNGTATNITSESNLAHGIYLVSSGNCTVANCTLNSNAEVGILARTINYTTIDNNSAFDNNQQIYLISGSTHNLIINNSGNIYLDTECNNNTIIGNSPSQNNLRAIAIENSNNNMILNNNCSNAFSGITFFSSSNNIVTGNWISSNTNGGFLFYGSSDSNTILNNTISYNALYGMYIDSGNSNLIYHNNFINNSAQARAIEGNQWDNGYPTGGNYWSDYDGTDTFSGQNQDIPGSDSIGDVNYTISDAPNVDNYPIKHLYVWWQEVGPFIELLSPMNNSIIKSGTIIDFDVWDGNLNLNIVNYSIDDGADQPFIISFDIDSTGWIDNPYTIEVHANDTVGNTATESYTFTIDSTLPIISLNSPPNNSIVQPGTYIDFSVDDKHLDFVNYSINGGSNITIGTPFNISSIGWMDDDYSIEIHAVDEAGNIAINSYLFTIDGTAPTVVSMIPVTNSVGIPVNTTLKIYFKEAMNTSSVQNAISISPIASILNYDWNILNTTLTITFSANLIKNTTYTLNIETDAKDVAGNSLSSNFIGSFTTWLDNDDDGIPDSDDPDDDNDGVLDEDDPNSFNSNITGEGSIIDYWWVFVLVGVIIVFTIFVVIKRKPKIPKGEEPPSHL